MEDMPAVSSSLEKIPQNPPISPALRPETIRHPDKRSKLENGATCGLGSGFAKVLAKFGNFEVTDSVLIRSQC